MLINIGELRYVITDYPERLVDEFYPLFDQDKRLLLNQLPTVRFLLRDIIFLNVILSNVFGDI